MQYVSTQKEKGKTIGFIPTMGALHAGHLSLVKEAKKQCDIVICSIFVNPTQFNNPKDLEKYPRMPEKDMELLEKAGCDMVFIPSVEEVYTKEIKDVSIDLGKLAEVYEGAFRPGHFDGVLMVVHRFLDILQPDKAFFGLKDYQQCLVVKELCNQAHPNTKIIPCAIKRDADGLAMSSRNLRLTQEQREIAPQFNFALRSVVGAKNTMSLEESLKLAKAHLAQSHMDIEYLAVANATNLMEINKWEDAEEYIVVGAVNLGEIRLIDNIVIE